MTDFQNYPKTELSHIYTDGSKLTNPTIFDREPFLTIFK